MKQQNFIWSNGNETSKTFKVYKMILALYLVLACHYGYMNQKNFPKKFHSEFMWNKIFDRNIISENFAYTDFASNWADISCAAWGVLSAQHCFFRNVFEIETWPLHALNAIAQSSSLFVCWSYFVSHL